MEDKQLKEILFHTQVKADENLKYRILHQINTEKSLTPAKPTSSSSVISNSFFIFGIMYALIAILAIYFYWKIDGNPLKSTTFIISIVLTSFIFSVYWLLTIYEDYRNHKQI